MLHWQGVFWRSMVLVAVLPHSAPVSTINLAVNGSRSNSAKKDWTHKIWA